MSTLTVTPDLLDASSRTLFAGFTTPDDTDQFIQNMHVLCYRDWVLRSIARAFLAGDTATVTAAHQHLTDAASVAERDEVGVLLSMRTFTLWLTGADLQTISESCEAANVAESRGRLHELVYLAAAGGQLTAKDLCAGLSTIEDRRIMGTR